MDVEAIADNAMSDGKSLLRKRFDLIVQYLKELKNSNRFFFFFFE